MQKNVKEIVNRYKPYLERVWESPYAQRARAALSIDRPARVVRLVYSHSHLSGQSDSGTFRAPAQRNDDGALSDSCKEAWLAEIQMIANASSKTDTSLEVHIEARGAILREVELPSSIADDPQEALALQIEESFPLGPDELAWGNIPLEEPSPESETRPFQIVALRNQAFAELIPILEQIQLPTQFAVHILECARPDFVGESSYQVLSVTHRVTEILNVQNRIPRSLKTLPGGWRAIIDTISTETNATSESVQETLNSPRETWTSEFSSAVHKAIQQWGASISLSEDQPAWIVTDCAPFPQGIQAIAEALHIRTLKPIEAPTEPTKPWIPLTTTAVSLDRMRSAKRELIQWGAIAAGLAILLLFSRDAEVWIKRPGLNKRLAAIEQYEPFLNKIDKEVEFLQTLERSQAPYVETLSILSHHAPQGTKITSISMRRDGEISFSVNMQKPEQASQYRAKLVESPFFENVISRSITPGPKRKSVSAKLSATWANRQNRGQLPKEIVEAKPADR